jgi:hypothetical protein
MAVTRITAMKSVWTVGRMSLGFTVLETRTQASAQVAPVSRMSNLFFVYSWCLV